MKFTGPVAKDSNLWMLTWEEVHRIHQEEEHYKKSRKCHCASLKEGGAGNEARSSNNLSRKAMKWRMSKQMMESCWMERNGVDQSQHRSAEKKGGVPGFAVCS